MNEPTQMAEPPAVDGWFRALFEQSPTAMGVIDAACRFRLANPSMCQLLGRTAEELVAMTITDLTHPADLEETCARFEALGGGTRLDWEKRYLRPDGRLVWGRVTASRWVGPDGEAWYLVVVQDVTERRAAELRLEEREAELATLFDEAPFAMAVNAPDGAFLHVNRSMCLLTGYTVDEFADLTWLDLVDPLDREASRANDELVRRGLDGERDVVRRIRTKAGESVFLRCKSHVIRNEDGLPRYWVGQFVDLTPERRHEEERRTFAETLRQSQRTEAVGRVAGGVVHDFNNMLAVILNVAELAKMRATDPRMREYTENIYSAATRAAALSRRLMSIGRRDEMDPELLDLNAVIAEIRHLLQRATGEDIAFATELTTPLRAVRIGRPQVEQVLLNLAVNARDAMPLGGRLTLRTSHRTLEAADGVLSPGEYVALEVEDNGTGMPEELVPQVFEAFFTTKAAGRGTGLGLSIVHQVVTSAGGAVQVRTTLGVGTTFIVLLPAVATGSELPTELPPEVVIPGRGERILVVEDELTLLDLTTTVLAENGYVPLAAPGAQTALELVRSMRSRIDLLLTDVVMPGASGTQLAERVRESHPETRVLFMSGHSEDRVARHTSPDQIILRKPFSSMELLSSVRRALDAPRNE